MLTIDTAAAKAADFIETIPEYPGTYAGRGIVICAGGVKYLTCAWVLIKILRHLRCTLPIEVWYLGEDEGDPDWIELVEPLRVTCVDAMKVAKRHPHPRLGGWESKSYAILHSRFKEVLLLDADNVPTVDPTRLFDEPLYRRHGAIFWPDGPRMGPDHSAWSVFGVPYRDEPEVESGQALIDKQKCWAALNLCDWYNRNSGFFYEHVYGDKDTFRFAWHRTKTPFPIPSKCGSLPFTIAQYDFQDNLLFQHRCHDKWSLLGNRVAEGFVHEAFCLEAVRDLRRQWSPMHRRLNGLDAQDRERISSFVGQTFFLERVGVNQWPITLAADGWLASGWNDQACFWWFQKGELVLAGLNGRIACRLRQIDGGHWLGDHAFKPRESIRLTAVAF